MSQPQENRVRDSASYRQEARAALKGKWAGLMPTGFVLMLIGGAILPATATSETGTFSTKLVGAIGPFEASLPVEGLGGMLGMESIWRAGGYSTRKIAFIIAAWLISLAYAFLLPIYERGLGLRTIRGGEAGPGILRGAGYWKTARVLLLHEEHRGK